MIESDSSDRDSVNCDSSEIIDNSYSSDISKRYGKSSKRDICDGCGQNLAIWYSGLDMQNAIWNKADK